MGLTTATMRTEGFSLMQRGFLSLYYSPILKIMIYEGKEALELVGQILESLNKKGRYPLHSGDMGYYKNDNGTWTAWDNSTADCWVEDFKTRKEAKEWLGIIDVK